MKATSDLWPVHDRSMRARSRMLVSRSSPFTLALSVLIPPRARFPFLDWYAYLRWVDDVVDEAAPGEVSIHAFLARELRLIDTLSASDCPLRSVQEAILLDLVSDRGNTAVARLRSHIRDMVECVRYDAEQRGRPQPHDTIRGQWRKEVESYLSTIALFCGLPSGEPKGLSAAIGAKITHVLRDFAKDLQDGQINISTEEMLAYGLVTNRVAANPALARRWIVANARHAGSLLTAGLDEIRTAGCVRYKLILVLLISKYQCYLRELRRVDGDHAQPLRLRRTAYLSQVGRNLTITFSPWAYASGRKTGMFAEVVRPRIGERVLMFARAAFPVRDPDTAHLRKALRLAGATLGDPRRVQRRFRIAALLGRTVFEAVAPDTANSRDLMRIAGLIYGYWASCAIELDRLMDDGIFSPADIRTISGAWLQRLHRTLYAADSASLPSMTTAPGAEVFVILTDAFLDSVAAYDMIARAEGAPVRVQQAKTEFYAATCMLMEGQMQPDSARDWAWYRAHILNSKNVQFLLAPFNLWQLQATSVDNLKRFIAQFFKLNSAYLHYQLAPNYF